MTVTSTCWTTGLKALSFSMDGYTPDRSSRPILDERSDLARSFGLSWVSVCIMADRLLVEAIQSVVFGRLREIFNDKIQVISNARLIEDLFAHGSPPQHPRSIYDMTQ